MVYLNQMYTPALIVSQGKKSVPFTLLKVLPTSVFIGTAQALLVSVKSKTMPTAAV